MKKIVFGLFVLLFFNSNASDIGNDQIIIQDVWARPSLGKGKMSAVYMKIYNKGPLDFITKVSTKISKKTEMHKTVTEQGVSQMVHIDRLAIPEDSAVILKPKGLHVMLMGLYEPLKVGEKFELEVTFKHGGVMKLDVPVRKLK